MAQNLFEKYGIHEVADVTLFRIERKDETYESQRKIPISSILKGALTLETVYPLDDDGKGSDTGYEAYVFKNADILTHYNYDCDDQISVIGKGRVIDNTEEDPEFEAEDYTAAIEYYETPANFVAAVKDNTLTIDTAFDSNSLHNVSARIPNWLTSSNFSVKDVTISNIKLADSANTVQSMENVEVVNPSRMVTLTVKRKSSLSDLTYPNAELFNEFTIEVPYKDKKNWEVIDAAIVAYFAKNSINVDESDIYGVYYIAAEGQTSISTTTLKVTSGTVEFDYYDDDTTKTYHVTVTIDGGDSAKEIADVPTSVANDIVNGTSSATTAEKVMALKAFAAVGTVAYTLEGEPVEEDEPTVNYDNKYSNFTNIVFGVKLLTYPIYSFEYKLTIDAADDILTGIYDVTTSTPDESTHYSSDIDYTSEGTHEFSYAEQICLLFAKNQNLITKRGTRYQFTNPETLFGDIEFSDDFATAPNSTERIVVCGLIGKLSENLYDKDEVNDAIKMLSETIEAKAYDVTYTDYAELIVEDEMGYYMPEQLGVYNRATKSMDFFVTGEYKNYASERRGVDIGINSAISTWGNDKHYSINDAIDALKQEKKLIDSETGVEDTGFKRIFGGYKVLGKDEDKTAAGRPYDDGDGVYQYTVNGEAVKSAITGAAVHSGYSLDSVLNAIATMEAQIENAQLRVENEVLWQSNRAIYVDATAVSTSARAHIYLLRNISAKSLATDTEGIFEFYDKKGNKLHYQDKIFAGTEYLALVVIGQSGLVFVVNRHGTKNINKIAWMVNENGYLTDKQTEKIVKNGLIHTVDVTICDETFDATCTVGSIKIRKTKKNVLHYVPVLYLDSLKISTLEQASETVDATGGKGNARLITWDYGKEITLTIEDALFSPASMAAIWGSEHGDVKNGVKDTHYIDRFEKITAKRNFIVPAGNSEGTPTEGNITAQAVYYDPKTMEPFQDGTPIAEGEVILKFTRSVAYDDNSIGNTIEISADKFPGTYRVIGETYVRDKKTGEDQRFQFIIPEAKMSTEDTSITLEADGDPVVFDFTMNVLRPENGVMMKFVQFDVEENVEENDGSTMVKDTENLNLLDDAEMYKVSGGTDEELVIGATEY